jgi:hypothetical protein
MSQPVKLSDALVLDARLAAEAQERSIAGQVEFWAKLGRSVELLLDGQEMMALRRTGVTPLSELVEMVDTPAGRKKLKDHLESEPYPHFEAHPTQAGLLIRTEENGQRTVGRFVNREFIVESILGYTAAQSQRAPGSGSNATQAGTRSKVAVKKRA